MVFYFVNYIPDQYENHIHIADFDILINRIKNITRKIRKNPNIYTTERNCLLVKENGVICINNIFKSFKKIGKIIYQSYNNQLRINEYKQNNNHNIKYFLDLMLNNVHIHNKQFKRKKHFILNNNASFLTRIYMFLWDFISELYIYNLISNNIQAGNLNNAKIIFINSLTNIFTCFANHTYVFNMFYIHIKYFKKQIFEAIIDIDDKELLALSKELLLPEFINQKDSIHFFVDIYSLLIKIPPEECFNDTNTQLILSSFLELIKSPYTEINTTKNILKLLKPYLHHFGYKINLRKMMVVNCDINQCKNPKLHQKQSQIIDPIIAQINQVIKIIRRDRKNNIQMLINLLNNKKNKLILNLNILKLQTINNSQINKIKQAYNVLFHSFMNTYLRLNTLQQYSLINNDLNKATSISITTDDFLHD